MARTLFIAAALGLASGCGGGVPIEIRIDELGFDMDLNEARDNIESSLQSAGFLPLTINGLPERWPDDLPDIEYPVSITTPPEAVDLTPPEGSEEAEKYKEINKVEQGLRRIEINRLVLRVDQNTATLPIPELELQIADDPEANPDDPRQWFPVGRLPGADRGFTGDIEFEWLTGGESYLNAQLGDEAKEFAVRTVGRLDYNTEDYPDLPRGIAKLRLIVVATFFVEPEKII